MAGNGHQPQVPVQPLPAAVNLGQAVFGAQQYVLVQISTPQGTSIHFFEPDAAIKIGQELQRLGAAARAGIVLPGGPNA